MNTATKELIFTVNPSVQQETIVLDSLNTDTHTAISAGPGSGKSFILTQIVLNNIGKRVLIIVFNSAIKAELKRKVGNLATVMTFHQLGNSLINANKTGKFKWVPALHDKKNGNADNKYKFIIRNLLEEQGEHYSLLDEIRSIVNYIRITNTDIKDIHKIIAMLSFYNIKFTTLNSIQLAIQAIEIGNNNFHKYQHVDFADMLYLPNAFNMQIKMGMQLGAQSENTILGDTFDLILVDEAQDQSDAMANLLLKYIFPKTKLIAVGDKMQSINGFAGSLPDSLDRLINKFDMNEFPLSMTYRCPQAHVDYVNDIFGTELTAFNQGGEIHNINYGDMVSILQPNDFVLGRVQNSKEALLIPLFHSLLREGKACSLLGIDIAHIVCRHLDEVLKVAGWDNIRNSFDSYSDDMTEFFRAKGWTNKLVDFNDDAYLVRIMLEYASINNIMNYDSFVGAVKALNYEKKDSIILSTTHRAKGLEADNVFLLNANEYPYTRKENQPWMNNQELNLFYVALTRSKENLYLVN